MVRLLDLLTHDNSPYFRQRLGTRNPSTGTGLNSRLTLRDHLADRLVRADLVFVGHPYSGKPSFDPSLSMVLLDGDTVTRALLPEEQVIPLVAQRLSQQELWFKYPDLKTWKGSWDIATGLNRGIVANAQLSRRFSDDLQSGGRVYLPMQNIRSDLRPLLMFGSSPSCELDYRAVQVHAAYSLVDEECPWSDPYVPPGFEKADRDLSKACFAIGASVSPDQANQAVSILLETVWKQGAHLSRERAEFHYRRFWDAHPMIRWAQHSEAWRKLQLVDSEACLRVMAYLEEREIPCLPIHDSFVVPVEEEEFLHQAMTCAIQPWSSKPLIEKKH